MNLLRNLLNKIKLSISLKKRDRKDAGKIGENVAAKFLTRKGYSILEQNFRVKGGEIDIVASKDNTLVFVEVKSRTSTEYGTGEEAVTYTKRKRLILAAKIYLKYKDEDYNCRFDVIAILFDKTKKAKEINHIEDAFTL